MNKIIYAGIAAATMMGACSSATSLESQSRSQNADAPQSASKLDAPMLDIKLLYAQPFTVEQPFSHDWHSKPQSFNQGTLIVLEVNEKFARSRDSLEPVLYAGRQTVNRLNRGLSGRVIGIIPGAENLEDMPIWYGAPDLPERLTDDAIEKEYLRASDAGLRKMSQDRIANVMAKPVKAENLTLYLREYAAEVVLEYSPQEGSLAKAWRLPSSGAQLQ